jgi:hypothetical protein
MIYERAGMGKTETYVARGYAVGYTSSADDDAEMTRFATIGHADGWRLLECIERNAKWFTDKADQYAPTELADVTCELDYLRTWVREYHGRYTLRVEQEVWHENDEGWDDNGEETTQHLMFHTLREVADYMARELLADRVEDDVWNVRTVVRSDVSEYYRAGTSGGVTVPVPEANQYTVSAAHGFTERTWCWVILSVRAYFARISGR